MASENRTINLVPWNEAEDLTVTPPTRVFPRNTDLNDWQDMGVKAMLLDQSAAFTGWKGALFVYGQYSLGTGLVLETGHYNPFQVGIPVALDMANRVMMSSIWGEDNILDLPKGINYNPNTFAAGLTPVQKLWHTGTGGHLGAGIYWQPWAGVNFYVYADSADTTIFTFYNNTGASVYFAFSSWIWESD